MHLYILCAIALSAISLEHNSFANSTRNYVKVPLQYTAIIRNELPYSSVEISMIESVVMHEVGNCSEESKITITNVIVNRLKDGRFGHSIYEVLHSKGQFGAIHNYYDHEIEPDEACRQAVMKALRGKDNSQGALYYCNMNFIHDMKVRRWFESLDFLFELDGQKYYK